MVLLFPLPFRPFLLGSLAVLLTSCAAVQTSGPVGFWSRNRFDRSGDYRQGPWRSYFDAAEQHLANKGRYRHGQTVGKWQYYSPNGQLERTERFHRAGLVSLTFYHSNGQVAKRGRARYVDSVRSVHFFWFGEWRCYSETGQRLPSEYYLNGVKSETPLTTPSGAVKKL